MPTFAASVILWIFRIIPWLIFIVGIVIALATRAKHPRRSTFAAIGLAILLLGNLPTGIWTAISTTLYRNHSINLGELVGFSNLTATVWIIAQLAGWAMIFIGLFAVDDVARSNQLTPPRSSGQSAQFPGQPYQFPNYPGQPPPWSEGAQASDQPTPRGPVHPDEESDPGNRS